MSERAKTLDPYVEAWFEMVEMFFAALWEGTGT